MSEETDRVPVTLEEWPDDAESDEGVIVNWFVREGATVEESDNLCEVQIDKVSIDVFAPVDGTVVEIVRGEEDEFTIDDTLAWIEP